MLDRKANAYSEPQKRLIAHFRDMIEGHLGSIVEDFDRSSAIARERLKESEDVRLHQERSRLLIEHSADDFFLHDEKGRVLDVNQQACQNMGYTRAELSEDDGAGVLGWLHSGADI